MTNEEQTQQTSEEAQQESTTSNTPTGDIPKEASILERADTTSQKLGNQLKQIEELMPRLEMMFAHAKLAGKTEANTPVPEKKEESPKEYKDRLLRDGA